MPTDFFFTAKLIDFAIMCDGALINIIYTSVVQCDLSFVFKTSR